MIVPDGEPSAVRRPPPGTPNPELGTPPRITRAAVPRRRATRASKVSGEVRSRALRSPNVKFRITAVDLAQGFFEAAVASEMCRIVERHRFSRKAFSAFLAAQPSTLVVFETYGPSPRQGRTAQAL